MCNTSCIIFGATNLSEREIKGKRVIEVGSCDFNGSLRAIIEQWGPAEYIGVDIREGPGVDIICDAESLVERFGKDSFDVVISTELLEHVMNWKRVISNIKNICKPNGIILITTRSFGFGYHGYPYDFWRYEVEDMKNIFSDCIIEKLEIDKLEPGVFMKARKPSNFNEKDLSNYELYSIIVNKRVREIDEKSFEDFKKKYIRKKKLKNFILKVGKFVYSIIPV
jgi:SAM-dependent methyltransferase